MRLFTQILCDIRRGSPVEEATELLSQVVRAVDETGKEGSVTVTLKIKPSKHGGAEKTVLAEVRGKIPVADIAPAVFFSDDEGSLNRTDPDQADMKFEDVNRSRGGGGDGPGSPAPTLQGAARTA